jgi:hypothetical protein
MSELQEIFSNFQKFNRIWEAPDIIVCHNCPNATGNREGEMYGAKWHLSVMDNNQQLKVHAYDEISIEHVYDVQRNRGSSTRVLVSIANHKYKSVEGSVGNNLFGLHVYTDSLALVALDMRHGRFQNLTNMDQVLFVEREKIAIYSIAQKSEQPVELYDKLKIYFGPESFGIHSVIRGVESYLGIRKGYTYDQDNTVEQSGYYTFAKNM